MAKHSVTPTFSRPSKHPSFLQGQIAIRFNPDAVQGAVNNHLNAPRRGMRHATAALPDQVGQCLKWLKDNAGLESYRPVFTDATQMARQPAYRSALRAARSMRGHGATGPEAASAALIASVGASTNEDLRGYAIAHIDPKADVKRILKAMAGNNAVEFCSRVATRWISAQPLRQHAARRSRRAAQADGDQWALECIEFDQVTAPNRQSTVRVGVLDTGVDVHHPDLGSVDIDYDSGGQKAADLEGHGTHVCGIVSAIAARPGGVNGVAQCSLNVWKVFGDKKSKGVRFVDSEMYNRALGLAVNAGCKVINLSLGGDELDEFEQRLVARLIARGVTVVAAMGNEFDEGNPIEFPAALPGVIAVGAVGRDLRRASFSNTGAHISLVAPGVDIRSTVPGKKGSRKARYANWEGTSFAAPYVTGAIAYALARGKIAKTAKPAAIVKRVRSRARTIPQMSGKKFTKAIGYGLLSLKRLI